MYIKVINELFLEGVYKMKISIFTKDLILDIKLTLEHLKLPFISSGQNIKQNIFQFS